MAGFEPAVSCARSTRNTRLSHTLNQERPVGVEPTHPPWQGDRLAATSWALGVAELSKIGNETTFQEHRAGVEPTFPHYEGGVMPLDHQCFVQVGPQGFEPRPRWLRAMHAAVTPRSQTIFCSAKSARRESNPRLTLIRGLLSPLSYTPILSRAGGTRTHAVQIKSLLCCRYTTTP